MKNYKFILLMLALTAVFATACTFCVGSGCPSDEGQLLDLEEGSVPIDVQDSADDADDEDDTDLPEVSDYTITPEIKPVTEPTTDSDMESYFNLGQGMSFEYPSEFIYGEGSFKYWDNFTLNNSADGAVFDIHVNPDGFGPFFTDLRYTVEEGSDGKLQIVEVKEGDSGFENDEITSYMFSLAASNGNTYVVIFSIDGNTTKYQDAFEDFIESFTIL